MSHPDHFYTSRFIRSSDAHCDVFVVPLHRAWWSRPYEYEWAAHFAEPQHVVLDAACGISHPFKFYLGGFCAEAHAIDSDPRILSTTTIQEEVSADLGVHIDLTPIVSVRRQCGLITSLPYAVGQFDRIFCISVLEHLEREELRTTLREFERVLMPDGLIVLTFDVPTVSVAYFIEVVRSVPSLTFESELDTCIPDDLLTTTMYGGELSVFRAVLKKRNP
jgi:SAM-dependent methyltransferase